MFRRHLMLAAALAFIVPSIAVAAPQWGGSFGVQFGSPSQGQAAYRNGFDRGLRQGQDAGRRGRPFRFDDDSDYRRGDSGYRREFGDRDRYRDEFRRGFETGYRQGYAQFRRDDRDRFDDRTPSFNGRDGIGRLNPASQNGYRDGFDAGLHDARDRNRYDPIGQRRYRSGDHGYDRDDGPRDRYQDVYRDAFRNGYDEGYRSGRR